VTKDGAANKGFSLPFARVALILAALIAIAAVAIAVMRSRGGESPSAAAPSAGSEQPAGDLASMITQLEKKMAGNPNDPVGWNLLGLSYYNVGRYPDAVKAYSKATALNPKNPEYWSALGEVQLLTGPGGITPESEASFRKALALNPKDYRARYFLGVKKDRTGDHEGAIADWIQILKDSPPGAPWDQPVRDAIQKVAEKNKIDLGDRVPAPVAPAPQMANMPSGESVATSAIPGPTSTDLKAATAMTPAQQDEMAHGMVDRLAARLSDNPKDANGWIMLMRAKMVLNDQAGARAALVKAKAAFKGDPAQQARFDEAAKALGMPAG
jgi:cytochrome c-type biogenesis protein CcmH